MLFKSFYTCFRPRIIDEDEMHSDDSIATILRFDFIPENVFNHHPVPVRARTPTRGHGGAISNTSCKSFAVATAYYTSVARSSHG